MFAVENVTFRVHRKTIVQDVSLSLAAGEIVCVIGANGAGKSTLIKVFGNDLAPSEGRVTINGQSVVSVCPKQLAMQRAVLPQSSTLSFPFQVEEVVQMGRAPYSAACPKSHNHAVAMEAMELMEITHLIGREYTTLSGGERQRVHLARVFAQVWDSEFYPGRYLLLDEPTSALDIHHQHHLMQVLRTVTERNVGVFIILHDLNLAAMYADRIVLMKDGGIVNQGTPWEVLQPEHIESAFSFEACITTHPQHNCPFVIPNGKLVEYEKA